MAFVASVLGPANPIEPLELLGVVDLEVSSAQHQHAKPLEDNEELVGQKDLDVGVLQQLSKQRVGVEGVDDAGVGEEPVRRQSVEMQVLYHDGVDEDAVQF